MKKLQLKLLNASTGKYDIIATLEFKSEKKYLQWIEDHDFYEFHQNKGEKGQLKNDIYSLEPTFEDQVQVEEIK